MMKPARSILFVATTLALFIAACSQPEDLQTPSLKPQFGSRYSDSGIDVASAPAGGAYVLSYGYDPTRDYGTQIHLQRFSTGGDRLWSRVVLEVKDDLMTLQGQAVQRDAQGKAYALAAYRSPNPYDTADFEFYKIYVYNPSGALQRSFAVGTTGRSLVTDEEKGLTPPDMAVDASGNSYVAIELATSTLDDDYSPIFTYTNLLRKYSPTGMLLWERTLNIGVPNGVAVAENGNVYVAGRSGVARYGRAGKLLWKKSGFYTGITTSGSSIYTHNKNKVFAFSSTGQTRWTRFMGGLNEAHIQDLGGDDNGNVFVSGKYLAGSGNRNAFVRKLRPAGASQWTRGFGTPEYDDATGVAALGNGVSYVTGVTLGSLAHPHRGNEDGYIRKLNAMGNPLWTR